MAEETITILKVGTEEAVKSIGDLRENVKQLKQILEETQTDTQEGWQDYQKTLNELKLNQNALKDAMYATSGTFQDVTDAASGASKSYNSLVHQMASLKEEFRATNSEARRNELGIRINEINNALKEMDAMQGNFQRNVGNYQSAFKGWAGSVDALDKGFKSMTGGLGNVKNGFDALAASPAVATFAILISSVINITKALKENEEVAASMKKALNSLKPVMDFFQGILETIGSYLADLITKASEFVTSNGLFSKIVDGVMGVGNAILKFVIAPFKGIVKAIDVLKNEGVKGLKNATNAFAEEMKTGVSFKQNFEAGQAAAEAMVNGVKSKKKDAKGAAKELSDEIKDEWNSAWEEEQATDGGLYAQIMNQVKKAREEDKKNASEHAEVLKQVQKDLVKAEEERLAKEEEMMKKEEELAAAKIATLQGVASSTSAIMGSIADLYENDEKNAVKNANKIKALRIASATIETISGAVSAFMSSVKEYGVPYGLVLGAASAASVTAAGIAQIAKIKSTKVSTSSATASVSASTPAVTSAPTITPEVQSVRTLTSASEEDRLNQMASSQRVYILASDIQASQNQIKTQVAEASF